MARIPQADTLLGTGALSTSVLDSYEHSSQRSIRRCGDHERNDLRTFKSVSLPTRLIQAGRCFYLVEAIPKQVVRLFLRNVRVNYIRHHIGSGDELALLQLPEVNILRALLQACSRGQDRNVLELIVRQVRKNGVHALEFIGRECTWQEGLVLAMVLPGPVVSIQVAAKIHIVLGLIKRCILI